MDIYLTWDSEEKTMLLPVNPSGFQVSGSQNNTPLYIHDLGEINLKGKRGLYSITLESFFPGQEYDFEHGKHHKPYEYYCKKIKALYEQNETIHLIITGTTINMFCAIESFAYGEEDSSGDVSYSLQLKEYREVVASKRTSTKKKQKTYTWKKGDTWPKVVKKALGSSETWKTVRKANATTIRKAKKKHPKVKETVALVGYKVVIK